MKISLFILATFASICVQSLDRYGHFMRHHPMMHHRVKNWTPARPQIGRQIGPQIGQNSAPNRKSLRSEIVRNSVCNAQTCIKCLSFFTTTGRTDSTRKMKKQCRKILTLRGCCTQKLLVRTRF